MMWYVLNENDEPVAEPDMILAARWFSENSERRKVVLTDVSEDCQLSTVFLGLDHSYRGGEPVLYESLWFGGPNDGDMRRYKTREEAIKGHIEMLAEISDNILFKGSSLAAISSLKEPKMSWEIGLQDLLTKEEL